LVFDGQVKQEFKVDKNEFKIGRHADNDVVIDNRSISGKHAIIIRKGDEYLVKDLDSTNGTKVNGHKVKAVQLKHGDHIGLVKHTLIFQLISDPALDGEKTLSVSHSQPVSGDETVMLNSSQIENMVSQYKGDDGNESTAPRLEVTTADNIFTLSIKDKPILIGKNKNCHINTGGWLFTPSISAVIRRDMSGTYSIKPETVIKINGKKIRNKQLLKNNDQILVRDTLILFRVG